MNAMAYEMSLQEFKINVWKDMFLFFRIPWVSKIAKSFIFSVVAILLFPITLISAQFVPSVFAKHINIIVPALPFIKDKKTLHWIKDVFLLYYYTLKEYKKFSLFRTRINKLIEEIDEHIDSLEFSLNNWNEMQGVINSINNEK